jgi:hypothetical protein
VVFINVDMIQFFYVCLFMDHRGRDRTNGISLTGANEHEEGFEDTKGTFKNL